MGDLKNKVIHGLFWQYFQRLSTQGMQMIISIILARLLAPKDFGTIALIGVFITLSGVIIDSGFSNALIQKKEVDQKDYASVFLINLLLAIVIYFTLFFLAPFIASFYTEPLLVPILRVISLTIILNALTVIQTAILSRAMLFKKSFNVNLASTLFSGAVGITMAYNNYGVWSLVFSQLAGKFSGTLVLWFSIKWKPFFYFSFERIRLLFRYGSKILVGAVFNAIYNNFYSIVIGKYYNNTLLGYYNRGALIPTLIVDNISNTLGAVMFPAISGYQDEKIVVKRLVKRMLINSSAVVFFLMALLIAIAKPFIIILLTEKWLEAIPFLQLTCLTMSFYPIHAINSGAITSLGQSGTYLKIEILKKSLSIFLIILSIPLGLIAMVTAGAVSSFISTLISAWPNKKLIDYSIGEQWMDVLPSLLLSVLAAVIVWPIEKLELNIWVTIIAQVTFAAIIYFIGALLFKFQLIIDIKQFIKSKRLA